MLRFWRNGTSSNRYSENRDFTLYFKTIKVDKHTLRKTVIFGKVQIELWPSQRLLRNTDLCACRCFKRKHLKNSVHLHTHNKQIESTYCALICITSQHEIFSNSGRRRWSCFRSIYLLLSAPTLSSLPSRITKARIYTLHLLSGLRLRSTNVCFTINKFREKWVILFSRKLENKNSLTLWRLTTPIHVLVVSHR